MKNLSNDHEDHPIQHKNSHETCNEMGHPILSLLKTLNFTLNSEFSMYYGSSISCWKLLQWVRFDLIVTMRDIYINSNLNLLAKFTRSSRSTEFKDILPQSISQMIKKTIPISTKIVMSYAMEQSVPFWVYWKVNGNWHNNMIRISQWSESHCRTNTSIRRKKWIQ